jgi:hypothetical protein
MNSHNEGRMISAETNISGIENSRWPGDPHMAKVYWERAKR